MKDTSSPNNGTDKFSEIALGLEAYFSDMAPVTGTEAREIESRALESFSSEDLALL